MPKIRNSNGNPHEVPVGLETYMEAANAGQTVRQFLNASLIDTADPKYGTPFEQICASEHILLHADRETGQRASTVEQMVNGTGPGMNAAAVTAVGSPTSRILFPAAVLSLVEDRLAVDLSQTDKVFEGLIAYDEAVNSERIDQPVINFSNASLNQPLGIAQLAMPTAMILITASDKSYKLPVFSQGIEVSDQAAKVTTIDLVALTLARTFAIQANKRAQGYMLQLLNGDIDNNDGSIASLGFAYTNQGLDSTCPSGVITQTAWMAWLTTSYDKRVIDVIVTDLATAVKIENRVGKPVVSTDDGTSKRINTSFVVLNPQWSDSVKIFLVTPGSGWPANTIMGMDSRYAVRRIRSLSASYQSTEAFLTKRSTISRFDFGEIVNRMFAEAFSVLTIL